MSESAQKPVRRPFHETIVDALLHLSDEDQLDSMGLLILMTKIPKNHDAIITAWQGALKRFGGLDLLGVVDDLLLQKKEAEAEGKNGLIQIKPL